MPEVECEYNGPERRLHPTCQYSEDSAKKAVRDVFALLGVDVDRPEQVREFQESLRFGDKLRKTADKGIFAFIVSLATILGAAMFFGILAKVRGEW